MSRIAGQLAAEGAARIAARLALELRAHGVPVDGTELERLLSAAVAQGLRQVHRWAFLAIALDALLPWRWGLAAGHVATAISEALPARFHDATPEKLAPAVRAALAGLPRSQALALRRLRRRNA